MSRPISATISVPNLRHNLHTIQGLLATTPAPLQPPHVWAVIKARAYGHGVAAALQAFAQAQGLAMLDLQEAFECRESGWTKPILMLEGFFRPADIAVMRAGGLTAVVHSREQIAMLQAQAPDPAGPLNVWLKLDTGMNRLGLSVDDLPGALQALQTLAAEKIVAVRGLMTHFADADGNETTTLQQCRLFRRASDGLGLPVSVCNSAATLQPAIWQSFPAGTEQWVRPGIALYGASPFDQRPASSFGLLPAMTLTSELISVRSIAAGAGVGYGHRFTAPEPMRVGIVACGYADGYPRHAPTGTPVTVHGVPTRLVGRVSMDMLAVDLTPVPQAVVGSPVVLWGEGGPGVDAVAQAAGTIGYELLCAVAPRVPKNYRQ